MNIAIVTDSTSDLPENLAESNQIFVVPNTIVIDGKSYLDGKDLSRQEFYQRLPSLRTHPTTATASPGTYEQLYTKLFAQGFEKIISIHASSLLSGIFNAASTAAQMFKGRVSVIDSQQISLGLGFQALAAAQAAAEGSSIDSIEALVTEVRQRVRLVAMLDTLEYVRRSGRVSWARARIGNLLQVKAFVEVRAGKILSMGEARTRRKGIERLRNLLIKLGPLDQLAILHTNAADEAQQLLQDLHPRSRGLSLLINVTTVIGAHAGPNGLGFAAVIQ